MKYKAGKLNAGKWAVFQGKQYFVDTVVESELLAKKRAVELSAQWYQSMMDECHVKWVSIREELGEDTYRSDFDWGDVLA